MSAASRPAAISTPAPGRDQPPLVVLDNLQKDYPGVRALRGVSMDLRRGEVHALIGENGAGKSTLIRILSGDVRPDGGTLSVGGEPVVFAGPLDARSHGIITIFQELMIVPELSVAENIFLGNEPESFGLFYSRRRAERMAADILETLVKGSGIRPSQRAGSLSTAQKQLVEIARALVLKAPVIVMDEPTAALSENEAVALRRLIVQLRSEGTSILYVSHRLDEVMEIADRVTVLRGGERIVTSDIGAITNTSELIGLMIGRPMAQLFPPRNQVLGEVVFSATSLTRRGVFENISFDVRAGEVVGFAGLVGAGRTEVMRAIFGADVLDSGEIRKNGQIITVQNPRDAIAAGIAYLPEDRKDHGLVLSMSGVENIVMASFERLCPTGLVSWKAINRAARDVADSLQFRGQLDALAGTASGGNQQKLVIGKWVLTQADILIFDEPTRGIDVGAKAEVYRLIHRLASEGVAVILVSSELPELINVCHKIYAMSGGRVWDEIPQQEFNEQRILAGAFAAHMAAQSVAFAAGAA